MNFLDAMKLVYEGAVYGTRPVSWISNGDVYRYNHSNNTWRLEFSETNYLKDFRLPQPFLLFGDWVVLSKEQVDEERCVSKLV